RNEQQGVVRANALAKRGHRLWGIGRVEVCVVMRNLAQAIEDRDLDVARRELDARPQERSVERLRAKTAGDAEDADRSRSGGHQSDWRGASCDLLESYCTSLPLW